MFRRILVAVSAILVATLLVFAGYSLSRRKLPADATASNPFSEIGISRITSSGKVKHSAISPDGKYVAQITSDAQGDSLFISHVSAPQNVLISGPSATEYVAVTFGPDGDSIYYLSLDRDKGQTYLYRVPVLGGASVLTATDVGPVGFSPDGKQLTYIRNNGHDSRLLKANLDATNETTVAKLELPQFFREDWNAPAWSPDLKMIACQARLDDERGNFETVVGISLEDGKLRPLTSTRWTNVNQPVWLADGKGLLVTASESEAGPNQVWHIDLSTGSTSQITRDLNSYSDLSITKDSSRLVAVQDHNVSSIWNSGEQDQTPKEVISEVGWIDQVTWTPDNRIVYRSSASGGSEIWVMNADGSERKQLTTDARSIRGLSVSSDGRHIFFASDRSGRFNIWRIDSDGRNMTQLTNGDWEVYPQITPDSQWIIYQRGEYEPRLWKVPTSGGMAVQLTETRAARPAISADGKLIAYHYLDPEVELSQWRIGIVSSAGGPRLKQFDLPAVVPNSRVVRWSPDGQVAFPDGARGLAEIWSQPLDGTKSRQVTDLKAERIFYFDWSRDGKTLSVVSTVTTSDAVLIKDQVIATP